MKRRILIATMLIFLTIIQSSGLSNRDFKNEQAISPAYTYAMTPELTSTPVTIPETSLTPSLHPNTAPTSTHLATPVPSYTSTPGRQLFCRQFAKLPCLSSLVSLLSMI